MMRVLESDRLIIKPVEEADLEYLLELRWDAAVMQYLIHDPLSMGDQKQWYAGISKKDIVMAIFLKEADHRPQIVGTIGLYNITPRHQRAVTRMRIDPTYQGRGIAFEARNMVLEYAFNTLNLFKITAECFAENKAIVGLNRKIGFHEEGLFRRHYYHAGKYRDVIQFAIFKDDYVRMHRKPRRRNTERKTKRK